MHCLQRSPFGWLELFALSVLASCTLTSEDFGPELVMSPGSVDEATDSLEPLPAASAPSGEADGEEAPDVLRTSESPSASDVALAPSEPTRDPSNEGDGASTPCASECCSKPGCSDEATSGGAGENETDVDCGGGPCPAPPGAACETAEDCDGGVCTSGLCQASSCSDGLQNADEAGIDCGGSTCAPCPCTYGTPEVLGNPNFAGNDLFSPSLSPDGLTLYFGLFVQGLPNEIIAFSSRPSNSDTFGLGSALPAPINTGIEGTPRLASDDLTLYFYSERAGGSGGKDIYRAQRSAPGVAFGMVTNLIDINSGGTDQLPWVSADGLSIHFSSDRDGDLDIHRSTRASPTDPWQPPERVAELNTAAVENGMTLTSDEREILFVSTRRGGSDFFRAVRAPGETAFGAPEYLASISSDQEDVDPALSPDGTELYFSSTRDGNDSRIWRVVRSCP